MHIASRQVQLVQALALSMRALLLQLSVPAQAALKMQPSSELL